MPTQPNHHNQAVIAAAGLIAALALSPASVRAQDARCPQDDPAVAGVSIAVDAAAGTVEVDPGSVVVYMDGDKPHRVCWTIVGLRDGDDLRLEDKDEDSPVYFPGIQRATTNRAPFLNSGNPARLGTWRYSVVVRDGSGKVVAELDPEVIVRGGGGG